MGRLPELLVGLYLQLLDSTVNDPDEVQLFDVANAAIGLGRTFGVSVNSVEANSS